MICGLRIAPEPASAAAQVPESLAELRPDFPCPNHSTRSRKCYHNYSISIERGDPGARNHWMRVVFVVLIKIYVGTARPITQTVTSAVLLLVYRRYI